MEWNANATFVLELEEDSEQLKVVRTDGGFDLRRGYWNINFLCVSEVDLLFQNCQL